jgi:hypothetical protein
MDRLRDPALTGAKPTNEGARPAFMVDRKYG